MANQSQLERAKFKIKGTEGEIPVHFNPASLKYTISNTLKNKGSGNKKKQYIAQSTGKLSMDLIYDTTNSGEDVRRHTSNVAKMMNPKDETVPPVVIFEWGLYSFQGMLESYNETNEFFSPKGIPLRATINITISSQDEVFEGVEDTAPTGGTIDSGTKAVPAYPAPGKGTTDLATKGGNPAAARKIAADNGLENMRFPEREALEITESVIPKPPSSFSPGGKGGFGDRMLSSAVRAAGIPANAKMSAGISAAAGAFDGLRTVADVPASNARLSLKKFMDSDVTSQFGTDDQSAFKPGGKAGLKGSASLKADVGKAGDLKKRIEFDGD